MTGCVSLYNIAGLISKVYEKNSQWKRRKLPFPTTPLSFDAPSTGNLCKYPHKFYTTRNYSQWPTFLLRIVWVYLHSSFCGGLRQTHLFCNRLCISHWSSSKVVDFGTNRKGVCDFLLVLIVTLVLSCTVSQIPRLIGSNCSEFSKRTFRSCYLLFAKIDLINCL